MPIVRAGPEGFRFSPFMKGVVLTTTASSIAYHAGSSSWWQSRAITLSQHSAVQAFKQQFVFMSFSQILFGTMILYNFRVFERRMGTRKFSSFAALVTSLSTAIQLAARHFLVKNVRFDSGPFALIFACFVPFLATIPPLENFEFLGFKLTDKSFAVAAGLMLMFSGGLPSIVPSLAGVLAGLIYHFNIFAARRVLIPRFLCNLFSKTFGALLGATTAPDVRLHVAGASSSQRLTVSPSGSGARPPDESDIARLMEMGFTREQSLSALQTSRNNIDRAIALLLES